MNTPPPQNLGQSNQSWVFQGRQDNGWFGHGTGPGAPSAAPSKSEIAQRIENLGHTLPAGLPASQRQRVALGAADRACLTRLMTAVVAAAPYGRAMLASRVFHDSLDMPGLEAFKRCGNLVRTADNPADLRGATDALADAAREIGLDRFKPFLHEADARFIDRGGMVQLARDLTPVVPSIPPPKPVPPPPSTPEPPRQLVIPPPPALKPGPAAALPLIVQMLTGLRERAAQANIDETMKQFGLDPSKPEDQAAAYAYNWAEQHGPWIFDTPQTGPAMEAMARRVMRAAQADPALFARALGDDPAARAQFKAAVNAHTPAPADSGVLTRTDEERALVARLVQEGKSNGEIQAALDDLRSGTAGKATATQRRNSPGVATITTPLPDVTGPWLSAHLDDPQGAPIPGQVARKLAGRTFATFNEFRRAFWKAVADTPELAQQFDAETIGRMQSGNAPLPADAEQVRVKKTGRPSERTYELHHEPAIGDGGPVYGLNNVRVVTPAQHDQLTSK